MRVPRESVWSLSPRSPGHAALSSRGTRPSLLAHLKSTLVESLRDNEAGRTPEWPEPSLRASVAVTFCLSTQPGHGVPRSEPNVVPEKEKPGVAAAAVIPAILEADAGESQVQGQPGQRTKEAGGDEALRQLLATAFEDHSSQSSTW